MSSSSSGYMDGVPVKISEQYKPPRRITLPQNIFQRVNLISDGLSTLNYDTFFEHNVLHKIREWRMTKDRESLERKERLSYLEEAQKKRSIEREAAENERRKQLTEVSYPSTDDLSELSSEGFTAVSDSTPEYPVPSSDSRPPNKKDYTSNPISNHNNILKPQLINTVNNFSLVNSHQPSQNSIGCQTYKINYSDFENDTSSPFDNMELKTINDIELLAQVLSNTQIKQSENKFNESDKFNDEQLKIAVNDNTSTFIESEPNCINQMNTQPLANENYPTVMNFIAHSKITNKMPNRYYDTSQISYNYPVSGSYTSYNTYNHPINYAYPTLYENPQSNYFNSNNEFSYQTSQYCSNIPDTSQNPPLPYPASSSPPTQQKSKSRSVPDIIKELEDELTQARDIVSKRSQNASPAPQMKNFPQYTRNDKQGHVKSVSVSEREETLGNPYKNLSPSMQKLAFHISQMGFPLPRTARVCAILGNDDKKIIEHLLAMDQLIDLGFSESKVSDALLKYNNDRDKALDSLIS